MQFITQPNAIQYVDDEGTVLGEVTFPAREDGVVEIDHTFVDGSLRGQGIAGQLLEHAADAIAETGRKAHPTCSYAVGWFEKHPERANLLA